MAPQRPRTPADSRGCWVPPAPRTPSAGATVGSQLETAGEATGTPQGTQSLMESGWEKEGRLEGQGTSNGKAKQGAQGWPEGSKTRCRGCLGSSDSPPQPHPSNPSPPCPRTLLLLRVVHADLEDGRALVAEQAHGLGGLVQPVDAAAAVLGPEQEVAVVAQPKGVVQLWALVHDLRRRRGSVSWDGRSGTGTG